MHACCITGGMERAISSRPDDRQNTPADGRRIAAASARSRVTNGRVLIAGIDGRSRQARRWRDLFRGFMADTGGRNETLCRSLATMVVQRERMDAALVAGDDVDVGELARLCGAISRIMTKLGLADPDSGDDDLAENTRQAVAAARRHLGATAP